MIKKTISLFIFLVFLASCGPSDKEVCEEKGYIPYPHDGYLYVKCYKNGKLVFTDKTKTFNLYVPEKEEENGYDRCIIDG